MYESCRKHNFSYIVFYIYIYIFASIFQHIHAKSADYTEKQSIPRGNKRNPCVFSMKQNETTHFAAFTRIFHVFCLVFAEIGLCGNDDGKFQVHFVAEQPTHTRHRYEKKSASRNTPPATRLCLGACRVADFFDFFKNFWYNYYTK